MIYGCRFPTMRSAWMSARRLVRAMSLAGPTMMLMALPAPDLVAADPITASFTHQNRTLLFRYQLAEDQNPEVPQGVKIFFHGNNTGTKEDMLDRYFSSEDSIAREFGLVPVTLGSPNTYPTEHESNPENGIRTWLPADQILIHELLQSHFGGHFMVDHERVYLNGASAGAGFLNGFVQRFAAHYGGGLVQWCGAGVSPPLDGSWSPPPAFADRFRIFVSATTEDWVYPYALDDYGYLRYNLQLNVRGDLEAPGGHCAGGSGVPGLWNWLVHGTGLPGDPEVPHMIRVSPMDFVKGVSVDDDGRLWIVRQRPGTDATLWLSTDSGRSLVPVRTFDLRVADLDAVRDALFVTHESPLRGAHALYRSDDQGRTFTPVRLGEDAVANARLVGDRQGRIFFPARTGDRNEILASDDLGETWSPLGLPQGGPYPYERLANTDPIIAQGSTAYLFTGMTEALQQGMAAPFTLESITLGRPAVTTGTRFPKRPTSCFPAFAT